jgi:microcystin-dependent protein
MEAFLGTILPWPGTYAPSNWAFCDGRIMQVNMYQALFAVIGNQYGGNGSSTFALPDLRGRTILGTNGQPPLTNRTPGQFGGAEAVAAVGTGATALSLTVANLPAHNHSATLALTALDATTEINVSTGTGGQLAATPGATLASTTGGASGAAIYQLASVPPVAPVILGGVKTVVTGGGSVAIGNTGSGAAVPVNMNVTTQVPTMPPFLALNYIICLNGLFPSRN